MTIKRKKDAGEKGNGGQFGSTSRKEADVPVRAAVKRPGRPFPANEDKSADELASLSGRGITVKTSTPRGRTPMVNRNAEIGAGTTIENRVCIETRPRIGQDSSIGRNSLVAVGARVEDGASLASNAFVSSGGAIGDRSSVELRRSVEQDA